MTESARTGVPSQPLDLGRSTLFTERLNIPMPPGAAAPRVPLPVRQAEALMERAHAAMRETDYETARELYGEARSQFARVGDRVGTADSVQGLAEAARNLGQNDDAYRLYIEAWSVYGELGLLPSPPDLRTLHLAAYGVPLPENKQPQ